MKIERKETKKKFFKNLISGLRGNCCTHTHTHTLETCGDSLSLKLSLFSISEVQKRCHKGRGTGELQYLDQHLDQQDKEVLDEVLVFILVHMAPKRHKHLSYNYLGDTKTSTCLQQNIKKCLLYLHEKLAIITQPSQNTLLNKKSEILSKCRHENKLLLSHFDPFT